MFTVEEVEVIETVEIIFAWLERENSAVDESAPPGALRASLPEPHAASPIMIPTKSGKRELRQDPMTVFAILSQALC
jgi:hypothetical protein